MLASTRRIWLFEDVSALDKILRQAARRPATIVLPESDDPRIVEAATQAAKRGIAKIILLGQQEVSQDGIEVVDPKASLLTAPFIDVLVEKRGHKGMTREIAEKAVLDPLTFAALLVDQGHADGTVAGAANTTADVVKAALQLIGRAPGARLVSSFFLMDLAQSAQTLVFADCALMVDPDAEELAEIAAQSAASYRAFVSGEPRVAMLSFSTKGSARHAHAGKVARATVLAQEANPDLILDGELQFDAAFVPDVAASKAPESAVAGQANTFIFPNLDSGNIAYKIAQRIGGAAAIGPVLQGLARPANDLSRGCSAEDALHLIAATVVQARQSPQP